jgi:hypothetical protein
MKIEVVGRVNEIANSEPNKVYLRLTPEGDSAGQALLRVERNHPSGVSIDGLSIGQQVRITVETVVSDDEWVPYLETVDPNSVPGILRDRLDAMRREIEAVAAEMDDFSDFRHAATKLDEWHDRLLSIARGEP